MNYRIQFNYAHKDYEMFLDGECVGSCPSYPEAERELACIARERLLAEPRPAIDLTVVYSDDLEF